MYILPLLLWSYSNMLLIERQSVEDGVMSTFRLRGNLISKFNSSKSKFNKWLKSMEKRERSVDSEVEGVEKSLAECAKLEVRFNFLCQTILTCIGGRISSV
jgi:hypothetical protein